MDRVQLKKAKKDRLVQLARRTNVRNPHLMSKDRLIDALSRVSSKKTGAKKTLKARARVQNVVGQIRTLPQYRLRDRVFAGEEQKIAETKFYLGPAPIYKGADDFQFPYAYGDNKIVIIVRDPWWLFGYWEVTQQKEGEVKSRIYSRGLSPIRSILRVYDVTDIEFNGNNAHSSFDIELTGLANNWYINVGVPNRSWIVEIGILADNNEFFVLARSNCVRTPRFGPSDVIDEEWMCLDDDYWKMFALSGGFGLGKGSMALKEMFKKRLLEQVTSGGVSSMASPVKRAAKKKGFWLMVDAELIVYGQTEPNAKLTVQGKPIQLKKDGSFSVRFALPDGRQDIPVSATSNDGDDTRTITPIVTRKTV